MRTRWKLGLAVVGIATTFTIGAAADGEGAPASSAIQVRAAEVTAADPPVVLVDVEKEAPARAVRVLDSADPWAWSPNAAKGFPTGRVVSPKPRPLDPEDPWGGTAFVRTQTPEPARLDGSDPWTTPSSAATTSPSAPARLSDDALREAVKRAVDAGDLDRAAKLLEILRTSR